MSNPSIEIPERIKDLSGYITRRKELFSHQAVEIAEFIDRFIEKPIEVKPFVVYEVKVDGSEERFLGFKSPVSAVEWTVAPYKFEDDEPIFLLDRREPRFLPDYLITVVRRITPDEPVEFGLADKVWGFGSEVLIKAKLSSSVVDNDGDIQAEFSLADGGSDYALVSADTVALAKKD